MSEKCHYQYSVEEFREFCLEKIRENIKTTSQNSFAKRNGISVSYLNRVLNGKQNISVEGLIKLSKMN